MENKIKSYRKILNYSQDDLARLTHVSRQTINAIENDKYDPELSLAFKIARALERTVDQVFIFKAREKDVDVVWCEKYHCELWQTASTQKSNSRD